MCVLAGSGFVHLPGPFARPADAWRVAAAVASDLCGSPPDVVGDFVIPPLGGLPSRDFQTLHLDFGVPLVPGSPCDVARVTALYAPAEAAPSDAATRLVPLRGFLAQRRWPPLEELLARFVAYGATHGAWEGAVGYVEGSFARIVEAALAETPVLPSIKANPEFLCGMEFAALADERSFFADRGLRLEGFETEVVVRPGEMLLFDNLAIAHGRRGRREPGELLQRVFGHQQLPVGAQASLRDRLVGAAFDCDDTSARR